MTHFSSTRMAMLAFAQTARRPRRNGVAPSRLLPKLACVPGRANFVQVDSASIVQLECISEVKIRTLGKQWKHYFAVKGQGTLYGLHSLQPSDSIIIVEGQIDKLSLEEAGYSNVVSVPDGAPECVRKQRPPLEADKSFAYLWQSQEYLQHASCILLASDNDPPGHALAEELARRLGRERCLRVLWQPPWQEGQPALPCQDANDVMVHCGADAVRRCIAEAKPLPIEGPFKYFPEKNTRNRKNSSLPAVMPQPDVASETLCEH